ncbi:hypothetical protein EMIHUDRAFT_260211, partial [Emiliania huxleyi CCMP1516]|uniref:CXXC-type domain-containing protein n=2 Tax=Emiliania huxleyi TaxID=2903 RepID=A0A0D3KWW3_EMIH1
MAIDVPASASVVRVRLVLTVARTGVSAGSRPSASSDCDECVYCLDKPRLGGPGIKRQKCVLKGRPKAQVYSAAARMRTHDADSDAVLALPAKR